MAQRNMTMLMVSMEILDWTPDELRKAVSDLDKADAGEGNEIAPENVTAWDVLMYIMNGQLGVKRIKGKNEMVQGVFKGTDEGEELFGINPDLGE